MGEKPIFEKEELLNLAKAQSKPLWCFLTILGLRIVGIFIPLDKTNAVAVLVNLFLSLVVLVLVVYFIILIYRLAKALKKDVPFLYAIGLIVPLVNLVVLASLFGSSTRILKAGGLKVGIMGCSKAELAKL
ncbi:MAG TPA: hypothetical protein PLL75_01675 [Candidatus Omnitrophota bacterium]|nr:hypothetical protein [Candidatus Omnitrophota bacterium]HPS36423.1 hypothetical protein [Candidatus Omnitrophota bacterium]